MACNRSAAALPRYLLGQSAMGCVVGLTFLLMLWLTPTTELGALLAHADSATIAIAALSSMVTFCPLVVATAVGLLGSEAD